MNFHRICKFPPFSVILLFSSYILQFLVSVTFPAPFPSTSGVSDHPIRFLTLNRLRLSRHVRYYKIHLILAYFASINNLLQTHIYIACFILLANTQKLCRLNTLHIPLQRKHASKHQCGPKKLYIQMPNNQLAIV